MGQSLRAVLGHGGALDFESAAALDALIARYPEDQQPELRRDAPRVLEHAAWVHGAGRVLDIGGGFSPFAPLLSTRGVDAAVVDTFDHELFSRADLASLMAAIPVELVTMDATAQPLPFADGSFDAVTSFDSLEHWHHSPRRLFAEVKRVAQSRALFVLGVPNAVNARKRIAVLFGKTNWARFEDWYEPDQFFGHVREPVVTDLERMAIELELGPYTIVGRNWLGARRGRLGRLVTAVVDAPLRLRPSLCANLYLLGRLPA